MDNSKKKRKQNENNNGALIVTDNNSNKGTPKKSKKNNDLAIVTSQGGGKEIILGTERTSKLSSPIMHLTGHRGEVYTVKFDATGNLLASGGFDKEIFLWNVYGEECKNYSVLRGHKGAVLELHWSTDSLEMYSASTDKSIGVWDVENSKLIKRIREHKSFINSCCPARRGPPLIASASDDNTSRVFDTRMKASTHSFKHQFPVTSVCWTDASDAVITGGIDNVIRVWDLRNSDEPSMVLNRHHDTITSLSVSKDGSYLLSNSMDNSVSMWDLRPYAPANRCLKTFIGAQHSFEKNLIKCSWSPDGNRVTAGSADRLVYVWDTNTTNLLYRLPGHSGTVNEVVFHPTEPIIASCSSDKTIYLGEIKP
ncbi:hypothetical protein CYY_006073 [Polysphondylium violaceum]|uniref:WD40 repeat-containing protein n=1 Tax=Polysphondylium violaceum TaxID=133409 RepID=A0A8J4V6A0_9MYCE|nr:hypothetical protein CYY_006073 [Polysphondylium violaceum]